MAYYLPIFALCVKGKYQPNDASCLLSNALVSGCQQMHKLNNAITPKFGLKEGQK